MKIHIVSERITIEAFTKDKGGYSVRIRRAKRNGSSLAIRWRQIRFADGAFVKWPRGWGAMQSATAKVLQVLTEKKGTFDALSIGETFELRSKRESIREQVPQEFSDCRAASCEESSK